MSDLRILDEREFPGYVFKWCTCGHHWADHSDLKLPWWRWIFESTVCQGRCGRCVCVRFDNFGEYTEGEMAAIKAKASTP